MLTQTPVNTKFEMLYSKYAAKVYGFITKYSESKQQADEFFITTFCKVMEDISSVEIDTEKKIRLITINVCRPIIKMKTSYTAT